VAVRDPAPGGLTDGRVLVDDGRQSAAALISRLQVGIDTGEQIIVNVCHAGHLQVVAGGI
jgi:hypothetical protein